MASIDLPELPDHLVLRRLQKSDFEKGFLALLSQLTVVADTSREAFEARFDEMGLGEREEEEEGEKSIKKSNYQIFVVEETKGKKIVATATLLLEKKFIRGCGVAGHVEDVVVDEGVRGQKLGLRVVLAALEAAREAGAYKTILDCSEGNVSFYERAGLVRKEVQMVKYH